MPELTVNMLIGLSTGMVDMVRGRGKAKVLAYKDIEGRLRRVQDDQETPWHLTDEDRAATDWRTRKRAPVVLGTMPGDEGIENLNAELGRRVADKARKRAEVKAVLLKMPPDLLGRLEAARGLLAAMKGKPVTRTRLILTLLDQGLKSLEKKAPKIDPTG